MIYKNKNNLDLQKISDLLKENKFDFVLKEDKIIINSNGIENHISINQDGINFQTATPILLNGLFWVIGAFLSIAILMFVFKMEDRMWIGGISVVFASVFQGFAPFFYKIFSSRVLEEKKKIMGLILNYKIKE